MISLYVSDVGDGLAAGIRLVSGKRIQVDCGSQQHRDRASRVLHDIRPDIFILSHFHSDHYNGVSSHVDHFSSHHQSIKKVYIPRIPNFEDKSLRRRFSRALFATNLRVLGHGTGSMEADFLNLISSINRCSFSYSFLSRGDKVSVDSSKFDVLWPPNRINADNVVKSVRDAVDDFDSALSEDKETSRIYNRLVETRVLKRYLSEEEGTIEPTETEHFERDDSEIPEVVSRANKSLRNAANRLSLAFREDNRLLFMGDLEKSEIRQVINKLDSEGMTDYFSLVTPHHGTHWHDSLKKLKCHNAFSSLGSKLSKHYCTEYKKISYRSWLTYFNGSLVHPVRPISPHSRDWRHLPHYPWRW